MKTRTSLPDGVFPAIFFVPREKFLLPMMLTFLPFHAPIAFLLLAPASCDSTLSRPKQEASH